MNKDNAIFDIMEITHKYHNAKMTGQQHESETQILRAVLNLAFEALNDWDSETINEKMDKINGLICDLQDTALSIEQYKKLNQIDRVKETITNAISD